MFKSGCQFKSALKREIDRRRFHVKRYSITKQQAESWIGMKLDYDLRNEEMVKSISLSNCPKGVEHYLDVVFDDEVVELLLKLAEYPNPQIDIEEDLQKFMKWLKRKK